MRVILRIRGDPYQRPPGNEAHRVPMREPQGAQECLSTRVIPTKECDGRQGRREGKRGRKPKEHEDVGVVELCGQAESGEDLFEATGGTEQRRPAAECGSQRDDRVGVALYLLDCLASG